MSYNISTTYGKYQYPPHFKYPEGFENYFLQNTAAWKTLLDNYPPTNVIEIGALHGGCSVWLLENYVVPNKGKLHCLDINLSPALKNNLIPYADYVDFRLGLSSDSLIEMIREYKEPIVDLVYVDGSHIAKHVMEDAILSWKLLKFNGIMIFDDYGWGATESIENQPKTGIDAFLNGYQSHFELLAHGWQIVVKKVKKELSEGILGSNYAESNPHFNKENY